MRRFQGAFLVASVVAVAGCGADQHAPAGATPSSATPTSPQASSNHLFYELDIEGRTVVLDLTPNDTIVAKDYREYMVTDSGLDMMPAPTQRPSCMYRGGAAWADGGKSTGPAWSALNHCDGFSGMVAIDGETWIIAPGRADDEVLLSRMSEKLDAHAVSVTIRHRTGPVINSGAQGAVATDTEALTTPTKYLELVTVSDAARFEELGMDAVSDTLQIANLTDSVFRNGTLSPSIAIVVTANVVIPGGTDPWPLEATGEVDSGALLDNFQTWANAHLPAGDDYALLTQRDLNSSTVGLGYVGTTCTSGKDALVQATLSQGQAGTVLAHELGHNLGMQHDGGSSCGTGGPYVMDATISAPPSTTWSSCSATALAAYLAQLGANDCLNNVPVPNLGPRCGDGTRDPGEQCDCGSNNCAGFDPCCNGATCQLTAGSACSALDGCCNNCQIAAKGTTCATGTTCAPAATCSGASSICYKPAPLANGTACTVGTFGDGRCFQGDCQSRNVQCAALYPNATAAIGCPGDTGCARLYCNAPGLSCVYFSSPDDPGTPIQPLDGSGCGTGLQCYQDACVSSDATPTCANGAPVNACGGCTSLATAPGAACNTCGVTQCISPGEVACSVADSNLCPKWVTGAWSACSATCGGGTQSRTVTCQDSTGTVLPDTQCANAGPMPVITQACSPTCDTGYQCSAGMCTAINACDAMPCAVGELCMSTGPGTYSCADLNECSTNNGGCDPRVTCTNTTGGRTCGALDACHPAYLCAAATATCPVTTALDGTSCSDQNACTQTDVCVAGACVGSNAVVCTTTTACTLPGTCNQNTGVCGAPVPDPSCNHCHDGVKNGGETGVDCGGSQCLACKGADCTADAQCATGYCKLAKGKKTGGQCASK